MKWRRHSFNSNNNNHVFVDTTNFGLIVSKSITVYEDGELPKNNIEGG